MKKSKYKVFIEGKNFIIRSDDGVDTLGFYATRFIKAYSVSKAEQKSMDLIRKELKGIVLNEKDDPPILFIEEIDELESFGEYPVPGTGFTWFKE